MAKNIIRLTESDLHRIVKESVNKILSEAINELDPRTYASYADKRRAQGQNDKAFRGTQAAANAWNKEYGEEWPDARKFMGSYDLRNDDGTPYNAEADREQWEDDLKRGNIYNVNDFSEDDDIDSMHTYFPKRDMSHDVIIDKHSSPIDRLMAITTPEEKGEGFIGAMADVGNVFGDTKERRALDVAKQMARGNGKYIKGKGWQ